MNVSRLAAAELLVILLALFASPVRAAETGADEETVLATEVARLKVSKGTVWVRPADSLVWEEYSNKFPVAERSRVSVPQGAEAELQFRGSQFMLLVAAEADPPCRTCRNGAAAGRAAAQHRVPGGALSQCHGVLPAEAGDLSDSWNRLHPALHLLQRRKGGAASGRSWRAGAGGGGGCPPGA
jgi:hypothetical protein